MALYLTATQKRLAQVGEALAQWDRCPSSTVLGRPTVKQAELQRLERDLIRLLSVLTIQWARRN
jgi:hypothetical protein